MDEPLNPVLPLSVAILMWTTPLLVQKVRGRECRCTRYELEFWRQPRLVPDEELLSPCKTGWMSGGGTPVTGLQDAWELLENEMRSLLRVGTLYLSGVMVIPRLETEPKNIPGVWSSEFKFDLVADAMTFAGQKFAKVLVSKQPLANSVAVPALPSRHTAAITPENLCDLSDDQVLLLLEEHAKRVIENSDARLIAPGKISLMPIVKGKMRDRAERGELLPFLKDECSWLADWIGQKVILHQTPKTATIATVLRSEYSNLKRRSKAVI